jgi:hypothetical protein
VIGNVSRQIREGHHVTATGPARVLGLSAIDGNRLLVTFDDGVVESLLIGSVDDEGFTCSAPGGDSYDFWARHEDVRLVEPEI